VVAQPVMRVPNRTKAVANNPYANDCFMILLLGKVHFYVIMITRTGTDYQVSKVKPMIGKIPKPFALWLRDVWRK
jgi:hypothetical protein